MRPDKGQWNAAEREFPKLVRMVKPKKIVVTGLDAWANMPRECAVELGDKLQAYRFGRSLIWCLAVPHPANRSRGQGFKWREIAERMEAFRKARFPERL